MKDFVKERNEAFVSMNEKRIKAYCKKYDIPIPKDETIFWTGVHKAVCHLFLTEGSPISIEQYNKSYEWLVEHGYRPSIRG